MAPSQANRLEVVEESLQELRDSIPALKESMEERIQDIVALHEESMWRSKEENMKNHEELKNTLVTLTTEVKALMAAKEVGPIQPTPQSRASSSRSQIFLTGGGFEMPSQPRFHGEDRCTQSNEAWRQKRLDLPAFQGENPDGWIDKVEHYFSVYVLNETEKVATVLLGLEGRALTWWQWVKYRKAITSWGEFKNMMLRHFPAHSGGSLCEQ